MYKPNDEDIDFIKKNYMSMTSKNIADIIGCSVSYVKKIGKTVSHGKKRSKKFYCNEYFFKDIDTYEKAYWLGFIMADGCVYTRKNNKNAQSWLIITLQYADINHLVKFNNAICGNYPIHEKTGKNGKQYCSICIVSDIMTEDLRKYGCTERKTWSVRLPKLDSDFLMFGFLNGYFDGDGSIIKTFEKGIYRYQLSVYGNKMFINDIFEYFLKFNIKGNVYEDKRKNRIYTKPFFKITFEKMEYLKFIFDNTYNKKIIFLDRKFTIVQEYFEQKYNKKNQQNTIIKENFNMNKIAKFEKVSYEQFKESMNDFNLTEDIVKNIYDNIKLPKRATVGSAGYDFCSTVTETLEKEHTIKIPTGIRCKIDEGWVLKIYPRSSMGFKYRLQLDNTCGIIDSDYYFADNEGHIFIKVTNDSKNNRLCELEEGKAFAQGIFVPYGITIDDEVIAERTGGIGSTDNNK